MARASLPIVLLIAFGCGTFLCAAALVRADSTDLRSSVETALRADPRSSTLSSAQIQAIVSALSAEASVKGMTASDINPALAPRTPTPHSCSGAACWFSAFSDTSTLFLGFLALLGAIVIALAALHEYNSRHRPIV